MVMPGNPEPRPVVVLPFKCAECSRDFRIECERVVGTTQQAHRVFCPYCGVRLHPDLPGALLQVFRGSAD